LATWRIERIVCARAPRLTSVHDPGWLRAGDKMSDGVIPLGEALRPLDLSRPSTRGVSAAAVREPAAAHLLWSEDMTRAAICSGRS
jgi:hypothetical protein